MKYKINMLLVFLGLLIVTACGSNETYKENNAAKAASDSEAADRVVATTVALVEIMDVLELDLVGVPTTYKELPERYTGVQEVGMAKQPDIEMIRALQATDVLSVTTLQFDLESNFEQTHTPATFVNLESIEGMYDAIQYLGEKYDRTEQAEQIANEFKEELSKIEGEVVNQESPTVLILLGVPGSYLVATENSYVGDLVRRAGGENAIKGEEVEFIASNTENLQRSNPDVILRMAHGLPDQVVEMFDTEFKENDIWKHFKAVQNDRVYDLEETRFGTTANLAALEALKELEDMLYTK